MPRVKLDKFVDNKITTKQPVKSIISNKEPTIGLHLAPAIDAPQHPVNLPVKGELKKLAGFPFLVDVETGLVYLEPNILKSLKNN